MTNASYGCGSKMKVNAAIGGSNNASRHSHIWPPGFESMFVELPDPKQQTWGDVGGCVIKRKSKRMSYIIIYLKHGIIDIYIYIYVQSYYIIFM